MSKKFFPLKNIYYKAKNRFHKNLGGTSMSFRKLLGLEQKPKYKKPTRNQSYQSTIKFIDSIK